MSAGQRWSRERPTVPGWYWWRNVEMGYEPDLAQIDMVDEKLRAYFICEFEEWVNVMDGEWQGPITPNEEA